MKAVVFDLDGTLLDVREAIYWQFERLTEEYDGQPVSREVVAEMMHAAADEATRAIVKNTEVPFEDIKRRHDELKEEARHLRVLYAGVDELLPILRRIGYKVAVLTSNGKDIIPHLERFNIHHHFDVVVTLDDITNPKPHPEGLERVAQLLAVEPAHIVMVGDTVADIIAGKSAKAGKTVGVAHGFGTTVALTAAGADHIITDIPSLLDVLE